MVFGRKRMVLKRHASSRQMASSTPLAMVVAMATPTIPIWGSPNRPKIKTAFNKIFSPKADALVAVAKMTLSMERMVHR